MLRVALGTAEASDFPGWCVDDLEDIMVFGALMERMVAFFCRENGLGARRGLGAIVDLFHAALELPLPPVWVSSTRDAMSSLGGGDRRERNQRRRGEEENTLKKHYDSQQTKPVMFIQTRRDKPESGWSRFLKTHYLEGRSETHQSNRTKN